MPPLVPAYAWKQDDGNIELSIPLRGTTNASAVDVYGESARCVGRPSTFFHLAKLHAHITQMSIPSILFFPVAARTYVKVSFGKYLLDLDLLYSINDQAVEALAKADGTLQLILRKNERDTESRGVWPTLTIPPDMYDNKALRTRRVEAVEERRAKEQQNREAAKEKKRELERQILQARVDMEAEQRARHEELQAKERHAFFSSETVSVSPTSRQSLSSSPVPQTAAKAIIPDVRNAAGGLTTVNLAFTPRLFPTPMRESKREDEDSWIARHHPSWHELHQPGRQQLEQADKSESNDMRALSERDPMWLKAQGDKTCRAGDRASAIHAYTAALRCQIQCNQRPLVLGNRALCFFQTQRYQECIEDCTEALAILVANGQHDDEAHAEGCLRLHVRRGAAFCQLGGYAKALIDYRYDLSGHVCVRDLLLC